VGLLYNFDRARSHNEAQVILGRKDDWYSQGVRGGSIGGRFLQKCLGREPQCSVSRSANVNLHLYLHCFRDSDNTRRPIADWREQYNKVLPLRTLNSQPSAMFARRKPDIMSFSTLKGGQMSRVQSLPILFVASSGFASRSKTNAD
jgi:hypothetical protein